MFSTGDWPNQYSFGSGHSGGIHFALGDGTVRYISEGINILAYRQLATFVAANRRPSPTKLRSVEKIQARLIMRFRRAFF